MKPLYRIEPKFFGGISGSLGSNGFLRFGGVGVSCVLVLAILGGVDSVVTFFLRRGSFLMRVNCSLSVVATGSLTASLDVVLLFLAAGFLSSSFEVTVVL